MKPSAGAGLSAWYRRRGAYQIPSQFPRPGCAGPGQRKRLGPLPFPLGSSPQAAPSLHQEAFPLSRNVSLQWKNGHCSFSGKRPPSPPSFLASCSWLLSPTAEQPRLSAHLRACLPSDWPPCPPSCSSAPRAGWPCLSLLPPSEPPDSPWGSLLPGPSPRPYQGLTRAALPSPSRPRSCFVHHETYLARTLYEKTHSQLPHKCPWCSSATPPGMQTTDSSLTPQGPR